MTFLLPEGHEDAVDRDERAGFYGDVYGRRANTESGASPQGNSASGVKRAQAAAPSPAPRSVFACEADECDCESCR